MDGAATIGQLKKSIGEFRDARAWRKHNDPKSLAEAIVIEAGELLEVFLWQKPEDIERNLKINQRYRTALSDELADVIIYLLQLASDTGIDVSTAIEQKMIKNALKYPAVKYKGKATNKYIS